MKRRISLIASIVVIVNYLVASGNCLAADRPIAGLWAGRVRSGPDVRGILTIDGTIAEIAGLTSPVTIHGDSIAFETAGGSLRGTRKGDRVVGFWTQPPVSGMRFATPVTLHKMTSGRWRGAVEPLDDAMTYFIPIDANGNAFLRNPERNVGRFINIEHAAVEGQTIKFTGGGQTIAEAPFDGETFAIALRGATVDFHRAGPLDEAVFYPRGKDPAKYVYRKPPAEDDGWAVATPEEAGLSRDDLAKFIQAMIDTPVEAHSVNLHAVLVARHGKLVLEEYFHGFNRDALHDTRSASKSLTSLLIGAGMLHGLPISPATSVYETMDPTTADPLKRSMTLQNLLTMSSGLDCDDNDEKSPGNEDNMQSQTAQPDWYRYTLDLKMIRKPGEKAVYCSCQPNLAGGVLAKISGRRLPDLIRDWVATPMQFGRYAIDLQPTGDAYGGGGARFRARDFMKLGQVILDGGKWRGTPVVSAVWANESTAPRFDLGPFRYGYLWWNTEYDYKGRKVRAFFAAGNGGQIVMGFPELDLLVNFWGGNYSDRAGVVPQRVYVPQYILPAIR